MVLNSSIQLHNSSFHVMGWMRTAAKCTQMKSSRAKRAKKKLVFIVKHANLRHSYSNELSSSLLKDYLSANVRSLGTFWAMQLGFFFTKQCQKQGGRTANIIPALFLSLLGHYKSLRHMTNTILNSVYSSTRNMGLGGNLSVLGLFHVADVE